MPNFLLALPALRKTTDLVPPIRLTYSDLKFDVESIGDGFGAIHDVPTATATKNGILTIFS